MSDCLDERFTLSCVSHDYNFLPCLYYSDLMLNTYLDPDVVFYTLWKDDLCVEDIFLFLMRLCFSLRVSYEGNFLIS